MFSYYGTKFSLANLYAKPAHDVIIEPFAGAAAYSMLHHEKQVILYDANPKICAIWQWLIDATPQDVLNLPDVDIGQKVSDFKSLSDAERWLIGFCINPASAQPKITASKRSAWVRYKKYIRQDVAKVKHWKIYCESYENIAKQTATWFIDPPYQKAGKYYFGHGRINFAALGAWCKSLSGQKIVCENYGADWLDFKFLADLHGMKKKNTEVVCYI